MGLDWKQRWGTRQEPSQELSPGRERTQWGAEERLDLQVPAEGNSMIGGWGCGEKAESRATGSSGWLGP